MGCVKALNMFSSCDFDDRFVSFRCGGLRPHGISRPRQNRTLNCPCVSGSSVGQCNGRWVSREGWYLYQGSWMLYAHAKTTPQKISKMTLNRLWKPENARRDVQYVLHLTEMQLITLVIKFTCMKIIRMHELSNPLIRWNFTEFQKIANIFSDQILESANIVWTRTYLPREIKEILYVCYKLL